MNVKPWIVSTRGKVRDWLINYCTILEQLATVHSSRMWNSDDILYVKPMPKL